MELGAILGAAIPLVGGLFGAGQQRSQARAERRAQEAQLKAAQELAKWEDQTNLQNWEFQLKIRDYEYEQNRRIFDKSQEIYNLQLGYNRQAASRAYEQENRKIDEYMMGMAFTKQNDLVEFIQRRGKVQSMETAGRSSQRLMRDVLSQFGRDNEVLAENLVSAVRQYRVDLDNIGFQKQAADMDAYSRLGLAPQKAPAPPKPIKKPMPGGSTIPSTGSNGLAIANAVTGAIASGLQSGMESKASGFSFWGGSLFG